MFCFDCNNDGLPDIIFLHESGYKIYYNSGGNDADAHFSETKCAVGTAFSNHVCIAPGDFNGDGLTDFVYATGKDQYLPFDRIVARICIIGMIHNAAGISGCVVVIVKIDDFVLSVSVDIIDTVGVSDIIRVSFVKVITDVTPGGSSFTHRTYVYISLSEVSPSGAISYNEAAPDST